jgi:hypothetical protein
VAWVQAANVLPTEVADPASSLTSTHSIFSVKGFFASCIFFSLLYVPL